MIHGKDLAWGEIVIHHSHGVPTEEYHCICMLRRSHGKGELLRERNNI